MSVLTAIWSDYCKHTDEKFWKACANIFDFPSDIASSNIGGHQKCKNYKRENPKTSKFYLRPKIHKRRNPVRPVVQLIVTTLIYQNT